MKHFIARNVRFVAVFSAPDEVEAARVVLALFAAAKMAPEEMEVMEFDPTQTGGVLLDLTEWRNGGEVGRI
jgi:hypothetical protein